MCPCSKGCQDDCITEKVCSQKKAVETSGSGRKAHKCENTGKESCMKKYGGLKVNYGKKKKKKKKK